MNDDNPNNQGPADMGDSLNFFTQLQNAQLPNMPQAVADTGFDHEAAAMLWMSMISSAAVQGASSDEELQENVAKLKHSGLEFHGVADEACPSCGTRHGLMLFSIYTKTPEELERIRGAIHREMAAIQADRGDRLTS